MGRQPLLRHQDLPLWLHDNDWIQTGYRRITPNFWACFKTAFTLHNETVNIWTHALGAVVAFYYLCYGYWAAPGEPVQRLVHGPYRVFAHEELPHSVGVTDGFFVSLFKLGAVFCLGASALFHCFSIHSEKWHNYLHQLDHMGIVTLIVTSFYPAIYYGFYCDAHTRALYLTMISSLGLATIYVIFSSQFRHKGARRIRAWLYISLGLSAVIPIIHGVLRDGLAKANHDFALTYLIMEGVFYISGALIYAERVPERCRAETFDYFGASHQIFHVLVLMAAYTHYLGLGKAFQRRHYSSHNFCPS